MTLFAKNRYETLGFYDHCKLNILQKEIISTAWSLLFAMDDIEDRRLLIEDIQRSNLVDQDIPWRMMRYLGVGVGV